MEITPFRVHVDDDVLEGLRLRLQRTRQPDDILAAGWDYGTMIGYYEGRHATALPVPTIGSAGIGGSVEVPTGVAMFQKDFRVPRAWAERCYNVRHWTEVPTGGHFAAMEEPQLLVEDIRAFFRPLR